MAPLNIGGPANLAVVAGALVLLFIVARALYSIFLHPLRSFPGPLLWRVSPLPRIYWLLKGRLPHKMAELHAEYGPAVRFMPDELSFSSADAWDDIYGHRKHGAGEFSKCSRFYSRGEAHNIVFSTREEHAALRRAVSHGFSDRSMRGQEPIIGAYVDLLIQRLREHSKPAAPSAGGNGKGEVAPATVPVDMREWLNWTTFDVIGDLGFGSSFGCLEKSDYHPWIRLIAHNFIVVSVTLALTYLGLGSAVRYYISRSSVDEQWELARAKLRQRMELGAERPDLIEGLIRKKDDLHLSFENLAMNANLLIVAGSETTATLLGGLVFFLTTNPDKLARVVEEVRTTFNSEEEISLSSVSRLPYMLACLNEALRCYPPVAVGLPRQVPKGGAYVAGQFIPESTVVSVWQWVINHNPKYWTEPTKFAPERFLGDPRYEGDRLDAMQPFSTGPRNCIGKNLAYAEMRLILAKIVWNFDMALDNDSKDWLNNQKCYILWAKPPLNVRLTPVARAKFYKQDNSAIDFELHHNGHICTSTTRILYYQPLLQLPPLHLAIMVAKDSPLLIDCPPSKRGAITTAHSTLDAAVLKLRMTAYMWQALTAEDLREKGLGRRSFRLDEEWGLDTTTMNSSYLQSDPKNTRMGSVAKVHIVRSEKTVAQLRDAEVAQQNHSGQKRWELQRSFEHALAEHGHPFVSASCPVVAGLILDSHYSVEKGLILAHAALGHHNPDGLSLAIYGSHTTYAWPRFLEEVPACLLDMTPTGDTIGNDKGLCTTMQGACSLGQRAMLQVVGDAFGARPLYSDGIMAGGAIRPWGQVFVSQNGTRQRAQWDLHDAIRFLRKDHFRLPGDRALTRSQDESSVLVRCMVDENDEPLLEVTCRAGLARVRFIDDQGKAAWEFDFCRKTAAELEDAEITAKFGPTVFHLTLPALQERLDRSKPWAIEALGMNAMSLALVNRADQVYWRWAMLLVRKHQQGGGSRLTYANRIDIRVGATMDGAVVYYSDGSKCNCGVAHQTHYGGHQSQAKSLSEDETLEINRVSINVHRGWAPLNGCQMTLSNGETWGAINGNNQQDTQHLAAGEDERIIGFYGQSDARSGYTYEFGIITAPKSVTDSEEGLPRQIYDMPELMNTDGGLGPEHQRHEPGHEDWDEDEDSDEDMD
ncbi:hypothetical protein DL771_006194 [Monosporascus sp. 5C6A]|nr:hypothetical protein DL771_006194 [Monosporascus sp. 5C6A]